MTTTPRPAPGLARRSASDAAESSLPAAAPADGLPHDRLPPAPARLINDPMSVCFEVCPPRAGNGVPEDDARRVGMARRLTTDRLRYCGLEPLVDDATLIVSGLVTNAILHSGGAQITFTMTVRDGFLHLAVHDEMPGRPVARRADDTAERGRDLFLVNCLASAHGGAWGTSGDGTTWCKLGLSGSRP